MKEQHVMVSELFDETDYKVNKTQGIALFNKGDLFEGRLVSCKGEHFFTDNFCYHPAESHKSIKSKIKALQQEE